MKRKDLEECRALKQELDTLQKEYLECKDGEEIGDTYNDYRSGFKITKVMYGVSTTKADKIRDKIAAKSNMLREKIYDIEVWLDDVDDSFMRDVIRLYYVIGLSQEEIAARKFYSQQRINQRLLQFWKDNDEL